MRTVILRKVGSRLARPGPSKSFRLLRFDSTARELALSFVAALFVIGFVASGITELLALRPEGSSMIGAVLGLTARPLMEALMQLARSLRQDAISVLRAWISRRWD